MWMLITLGSYNFGGVAPITASFSFARQFQTLFPT